MNKCPNCGSSVNQGEAFCKVCGTKIPTPQNDFSNNVQNQNNKESYESYRLPQYDNANVNRQPGGNPISQGVLSSSNTTASDDDLIYAYIGKNVDKLKNEGFSVCAFLLGPIYVLYRKMWLLGFLWYAISCIPLLGSMISLAISIFIGLQFKKLYLKHVKEQVEKIKSKNPGKTKEQLMALCSKKGGTSLLVTIIMVVMVVFWVWIALMFLFVGISNTPDEGNKSGSVNTTNSSRSIGELDVTIPKVLEYSEYSSDTDKYYQTPYSIDGDDCELTLATSKGSYYDNDAKRYLEKDISYTPSDTYSGISQKDLNNNTWYYATLTTEYSKSYYYAILHDETIYKVQFEIVQDNNKTCSKAYDTIVDSLRFN